MKRVLAQTRVELALTLRRGESLLLTIGIPAALLVFFGGLGLLPDDYVISFLMDDRIRISEATLSRPVLWRLDRPSTVIHVLLPGVLALAVVATAMVSLSIATGFERQLGVLKRLGLTPLGRGGLLAAKVLSTLAVVAVQVVVLGVVASLMGWRPAGSVLGAGLAIVLGTVLFAALGFILAGRLRAEANLAASNGLFLLLLFLGGVIVPTSRLPEALAALARVLPAASLSAVLRASMSGAPVPGGHVLTLVVWALAATLVARRAFRWE